MSSERKSITIDSASLIGGGAGSGSSKRRTKRTSGSGERKIRPSSIVQPSTLKKTLLENGPEHKMILIEIRGRLQRQQQILLHRRAPFQVIKETIIFHSQWIFYENLH
jgi:hypothetical protein